MESVPERSRAPLDIRALGQLIEAESAFIRDLQAEVGRVVVGQRRMVDRLLVGLLTGGHVLLEGVPGLAKTLTIKTLADVVDATFSRIQFTPDLLPADVVGTQVYDPREHVFRAHKGPIFANLVLADEINRAPAKVQSALLEAMQERQVTLGDTTHTLPDPFLVLATQNPVEQEGTYPLAEAQTDRFMLHVRVDYPTKAEEKQVMERMAQSAPARVRRIAGLDQIARARQVARSVYVDDKVKDYILDVVWATRQPAEAKLGELAPLIEMGASPRASIALNVAARAHAFLERRAFVTPEDVKAIGPDVLRHRLKLSYEAEAENVRVEDVVRRIFERVAIP